MHDLSGEIVKAQGSIEASRMTILGNQRLRLYLTLCAGSDFAVIMLVMIPESSSAALLKERLQTAFPSSFCLNAFADGVQAF